MTAPWRRLSRGLHTFLAVGATVVLSTTLGGQSRGLDQALLLKPPTDAWPTYHGDYSGRRYSTLDADQRRTTSSSSRWPGSIVSTRRASARSSAAKDSETPPASAGGFGQPSIKSTPLMVNGVLYFTSPDHVWAVDARTGREIWHYYWRTRGGFTSGIVASGCTATGCIS